MAVYAAVPTMPPADDQVSSAAEDSEAEEEAAELYTGLDRRYLVWTAFSTVCGPIAVAACWRRHGSLARYVSRAPQANPPTAAQVASWLGVLLGLSLHGLGLLLVWFFDVAAFSHTPYVGMVLGLYALNMPAGAVPAYFFVRKQHADLLEPVEPSEVYALRCSVRDCLACGGGELLDIANIPDVPPSLHIPVEHVRKVAQKVNELHGSLRDVGCRGRWLNGAVGVVAAAILFVSSYLSGHQSMLMWALPCVCVEAAAVSTFYGSFYFEHWMFCCRADDMLAVANTHRKLIRGNLAWVLRRTHLTRVVRLKLIVRNSYVRDLRRRRGERWWEVYRYLDSPFRVRARLLLLANMRRMMRGCKTWVPSEVLLDALGYALHQGSASVLSLRRHRGVISFV
eukprot:TRINITY_DN10114_c1_g1_i1.p1 TRINITY_DN10114_c1_g1~~TRINITY_DN10114_c1_g1_i1.p1  ORF type:complete len:396 (+),score=91.68 TRINITY_DN10114_c1_g1_i1:161-1348(+)